MATSVSQLCSLRFRRTPKSVCGMGGWDKVNAEAPPRSWHVP